MRFSRAIYAAVLLPFVLPAPGLAADIHVTREQAGVFLDCPNPAHNSENTSNTVPLQYCNGGTGDRRVIGSNVAIGRLSASARTAAGGVVQPLTLAAGAAGVDFDGDGSLEKLYSHPQAAIYNMAPSDSIEIHAGTYTERGGFCDGNCGEWGTKGVCDAKSTCWQASIVAFGMGPNLNNDGYGTAAAPAYLRGAVMNGSVDTWDSDGDKIPDTEPGEPTSYPVILSGDAAGDGVTTFTPTTCTSSNCSGDSQYAIILGCSDGFGELCDTSHSGGETGPEIDTDGDGTVDKNLMETNQNVDYLIIRDLEFTGYNGGTIYDNGTAAVDPRDIGGMFSLSGDGSGTDGIVIDHLYVHDNDYALEPSSGLKNRWGVFYDKINTMCDDFTEFKDSFLVQNNEKIWQTDTCGDCSSGCPQNIHDNRILVDIHSPRVQGRNPALGYWKSIDTFNGNHPKIERFWNNEVILKEVGSTTGFFGDIGKIGNARGNGKGEFWIYGNIFRRHPGAGAIWKNFWSGFSHPPVSENTSWRTYMFNNTFDLGRGINVILHEQGAVGELVVERNNAYYDMTNAHRMGTPGLSAPVTQVRRGFEFCTTDISATGECIIPSATGFTDWFSGPRSPATHAGLAAYAPSGSSPVLQAGSCDPDGDGVPGVDYDGDGINDTTWLDLAGNRVTCSAISSPMNVGAIQSGIGSTGSPPVQPSVQAVTAITATEATIQAGPFSDPDPGSTHAASQFQVDTQGGSFAAPAADSGILGAVTNWRAGGLLPGTAYASRVRYRDSQGSWSLWSPSSGGTFTTPGDTVPPSDVRNLRRENPK